MFATLYLILRYDGIFEGWCFRVIDDLLNLFVLTADALQHCLFIVSEGNTVERHRVVRCIVRQEERIDTFFLLRFIICHFYFAFSLFNVQR